MTLGHFATNAPVKPPAQIQIRWPDDLHLHFRDDEILETIIRYVIERAKRGLAMPNLLRPNHIRSIEQAIRYRERILAAVRKVDPDNPFQPLMTHYLTRATDPLELRRGFLEKVFLAVKWYPEGATTNSEDGLSSIMDARPTLDVMQDIGMPLCIHGELVVWQGVRIPHRLREHYFLNEVLPWLMKNYPGLKIILEHLTTAEGIGIVRARKDPKHLSASLTAHHMIGTELDPLEGGMSTDWHCLPVFKTPPDRAAIRRAATSGEREFFFGSDAAGHLVMAAKRQNRAPGGIATYSNSIEICAHVFEEENALDNLGAFTSENGARVYGLPLNTGTITLERKPWIVDEVIPVPKCNDYIWPFLYEENPALRRPINWRLVKQA